MIGSFPFRSLADTSTASSGTLYGPSVLAAEADSQYAGTETQYDLYDNVIELYEIPELVETRGTLADSQNAQISTYSGVYDNVDSAYTSAYQEVKDSYDEMIEELEEEYKEAEDKETKTAIKEEITALKKQRKSDLKEISDAKDDVEESEESRITSIKQNLYNSKKTIANTYQGLIFEYKELELSKAASEKSVELYQTEFAKAATQLATGEITSADYQSVKLKLESAENSLEGIVNTMDSLKRTVGVGLGWTVYNYQEITFGDIPEFDLNYADSRDLETDILSAYQQNYSMGQAYSIVDSDFTTWDHKEITVDTTKKQIQIAMESLLNEVKVKKQALEAAETSLKLAYKTAAGSSETKLAAGLLSRSEYLELQLNYIEKSNSAEEAKLDYQRAVFNYEQAVKKGVLTLGS